MDNDDVNALSGPEADRPLVLFVVNEMWFFRSHFLPWARAARQAGFDVALLATPDDKAEGLAAEGIAVTVSRSRRGGLRPEGLWAAAGQVREALASRRRVIIHAFGLHGMAITALARARGVNVPLAVSVTGLGFLATQGGVRRAVGTRLAQALRLALDGPRTQWLLENPHDGARIGLGAVAAARTTILTGAGVDLAAFRTAPMPPSSPLRMILVARLVRSKGVDLAVAAVELARRGGVDVTLTVVGEPDPANPASCTPGEIARFAATDGVTMLGRRGDVADLLPDHHLFILPSRGGEGLPRALLEAAAAARPAIVTDVPGCRDFVAHDLSGFIVPPENAESLAAAIARAAAMDRSSLERMGSAARAKVEGSATVAIVSAQVIDVYGRLLPSRAGRT